jgi:glycosyltransferase involved in cell wall biosynthesis
MDKVALSICIATRNRGAFIGATLDSIVSQATEQLEIVVLDGASTDNTEEVVGLYRERFPQLRYFRQETNKGIDRDFARAVELAQGDYCWLFSDDDLIRPGAIRTVLEAINNNDYALIIANSEVRNADLSKVLELRRLQLKENKIYKASESQLLLSDIGHYISFIGCVIIKRQLWEMREKENYFGSYFIHVGVIFQQPLSGDTLAIAEPSVTIRYANASWLAKYFEIWMFKWPSLIWSFTNFPDAVKCRVVPKEPWRNPKTLLHYRAKGAYTKREYVELVKPRLASRWAQAVSNASAHFPGRIANLIVVIYYLTFRNLPSRSLFLLDLANSPFCFWRLPMKSHTPLNSIHH